jgi:hypothetical protein
MAALLALLPMLIQLGPTLITIGVDVYDLIGKITTSLKQSTELTPAQSAELDAHIATLEASDWWKPHA